MKTMQLRKMISAGVWVAALLSGLAYAQQQPSVAEPLGDVFQVPRLLVKQQSRVVFYRLPSDVGTAVATVYVNGAYQASVQRGAHTEVCLPPSKVEVSARMVRNGQPVRDDFDVVNALQLLGGQDTFVRVSEQGDGRALMQIVKPELALPDLVKTRAQLHTLSRVPNAAKCQDEASDAGKALPIKMRSMTLGADALFAFGKSDVASIPPNGRRILDHLVDRIKTEFGTSDRVRIQIMGHADSFGSDEANLRLSKERAASIKAYFAQGGLPAANITTDGRGDKDPVVTCGKKLTTANVACNKPNRRVVVTVKVMKSANEPSN
jgi:OmpA-OmpF porin, OOP family